MCPSARPEETSEIKDEHNFSENTHGDARGATSFEGNSSGVLADHSAALITQASGHAQSELQNQTFIEKIDCPHCGDPDGAGCYAMPGKTTDVVCVDFTAPGRTPGLLGCCEPYEVKLGPMKFGTKCRCSYK